MQELDDADQLARTCGPALFVICTEQLDRLMICQLFCELFAVERYGACPLTELAANGHVDDLRQHGLPHFPDHARASADALITHEQYRFMVKPARSASSIGFRGG